MNDLKIIRFYEKFRAGNDRLDRVVRLVRHNNGNKTSFCGRIDYFPMVFLQNLKTDLTFSLSNSGNQKWKY